MSNKWQSPDPLEIDQLYLPRVTLAENSRCNAARVVRRGHSSELQSRIESNNVCPADSHSGGTAFTLSSFNWGRDGRETP